MVLLPQFFVINIYSDIAAHYVLIVY